SDGVGEATDEASGSEAYAWRLAALMGVTEGPGFTLIAGPGVGAAGWIAGAIEGLEVIALGDWVGGGGEEAGGGRVASGAGVRWGMGGGRRRGGRPGAGRRPGGGGRSGGSGKGLASR